MESVALELREVRRSLDEVLGWLEGKIRYHQELPFRLPMALLALERARTLGRLYRRLAVPMILRGSSLLPAPRLS